MAAPPPSMPVAAHARGATRAPFCRARGPPAQRPAAAAPAAPARDDWRRRRREDKGNTNCMVHVIGFPPYTKPQDLAHAFKEFGTVRVEQLQNHQATVAFPAADDALAAIRASGTVYLNGEFPHVKPYCPKMADMMQPPPKREFPRSKQKGTIIDPKCIDLSGDFHQQLDRVLLSVRLTEAEIHQLAALYQDLETVLQDQWPGCRAIPFGSVTTGLGIKSSDADCFMLLPPQHRGDQNHVNKAKKLLQMRPRTFAEILSIPRANTPIVKLFHIPTSTNCDLTFKTPLGAQNSKLISFLLYADPRLIPVAVLVKYWAKVHDLTGTGKLTNYALTMLLIFYLQQPPISILPSVEWLQRDARNDVIVDSWNTGLMEDHGQLPRCCNTSSIAELLGGFYEFYSMYNFEEMVICPFLGTSIKKEAFKEPAGLPGAFDRYKRNLALGACLPLRFTTALCVQDPFELSHNVASSVSSRLAADIRAYFKFAANAYDKTKLTRCDGFLRTVLLEKPKLSRGKSCPEYRVNLFPGILTNIKRPDWKAAVREVVFQIFESILKVKLGKVEEKVNPDTKKEKEKYTGSITKPVWRRRRAGRGPGGSFEERETLVTEEIIRTDQIPVAIPFQLLVTYCHAPRSAVLAVKAGAPDLPLFKDFGKFFISVMQHWFVNLYKPYCKADGSAPPAVNDGGAGKIAVTLERLDLAEDRAAESDSSREGGEDGEGGEGEEGEQSGSDSDESLVDERDPHPAPDAADHAQNDYS